MNCCQSATYHIMRLLLLFFFWVFGSCMTFIHHYSFFIQFVRVVFVYEEESLMWVQQSYIPTIQCDVNDGYYFWNFFFNSFFTDNFMCHIWQMLCVYGIGTVYDDVVFVEIALKFMFLYTYERYLNILCVCNEISESFEKKCCPVWRCEVLMACSKPAKISQHLIVLRIMMMMSGCCAGCQTLS